MGNCYFNLIQPEAIPVCYQGEHLVCASKNGQLLYQMSESEMKNIGAECKCLHKGIPNNIEIITTPTTTTQKIIRDGQLYIIKDGKTYNVMGIEIKDINF